MPLSHEYSVCGEIVDESGRPVPDSAVLNVVVQYVHFTPMEGPADGSIAYMVNQEISVKGSWFWGVNLIREKGDRPPGEESQIVVGILAKGYAPAFSGPVSLKAAGDIRVVLKKESWDMIRVTDEDGRPVKAAHVTGYYDGPPQLNAIDVFTNRRGDALIPSVGTGSMSLTVAAKGFATAWLEDVHFDTHDPMDCVLKISRPVTGRVVEEESGTPIPDAMIELAGIDDSSMENHLPGSAPLLATTDVDGRFTLYGLGEETGYHFFVTGGGRRSIVARPAHSGENPMEIKLGEPQSLAGKVLLSGTGQRSVRIELKQYLKVCNLCTEEVVRAMDTTADNGVAGFQFEHIFPGSETWLGVYSEGKSGDENSRSFLVPGSITPDAPTTHFVYGIFLLAKGPPDDLVLDLSGRRFVGKTSSPTEGVSGGNQPAGANP